MTADRNTIIELLTDIRDELRTLNARQAAASPPPRATKNRKPKSPTKTGTCGDAGTNGGKGVDWIPTEIDRARARRLAKKLGLKLREK